MAGTGIMVEVIEAIGNCIGSDTTLAYTAGGEGIFEKIDSVDLASGTLIVFCNDGNPYEVRVRRVTEEDCAATNGEGIIPPPLERQDDE